MLVESKTGIHYCWKWKAPRVRCWNIRIFRAFFRRNECKWPHQQNMTNIVLIIPASTVIHRLEVIQFACFVLRNKQHILKCRSNAKVREYSKSATRINAFSFHAVVWANLIKQRIRLGSRSMLKRDLEGKRKNYVVVVVVVFPIQFSFILLLFNSHRVDWTNEFETKSNLPYNLELRMLTF